MPDLIKQFGYKNRMQVPRLSKIVINMSPGRDAVNDSKVLKTAAEQLALIAGQKPVITKTKNAIATFKTRENLAIGTKVTVDIRGAKVAAEIVSTPFYKRNY